MGYNLNFDEIRNLQASLMSSVCGWQDLYSQIGAELTGFTGTMGYTGAGGTAIRDYVQEVHGVLCQSLSLLLAEYTGRLLLFGEGLYEYDSDKHACLNEDALAAVGERLEHVAEDLAGLHETARREMQKITDQVDTTCHSGVEEYVSALYNKRTELREYRERIGEYDHTSAAGLEEMKELVSTLRGLADRLYEGGEIRAEAWEPGSFLTGEELESLAGLVMNSGRFLAENGEAVSAAYEHYTQVWEEIIEELSEERVKQGALLVLASAVAIAGVILSAGTLAPEITATLGIAVAAYNSSNLLEGAQDIYYGLNGDPYTLAYNPMCETLFQGNREAYDLFGLTVNSAYAVVVPLNQFACATSTTGQVMVLVDVGAGAVTDYGVTRICEAAGADDMTTFIMGFGAGMLTGMAVDSLNPSVPRRPGSMEMDSGEFHTTIRELQRKGYLGDGSIEGDIGYMKNQADPMRDVLGSGRISNPGEWDAIIQDLERNGVDIRYREGGMAYAPGMKDGAPGELIIDMDASLSALKHEYQHFLDAQADGFPSFAKQMFEDPKMRVIKELRAYMVEIKEADRLGLKDVSRQLFENYRQEREWIVGQYIKTGGK